MNKEKKTKIILIILIAVLTIALTIVAVMLIKKTDNTPSVIGGGEPIPEEQNKQKNPNVIQLPAYGELNFKKETKEQEVVLRNPGENTCLIRISLILNDGTTIYTSELVEPGYYTKPIELIAPMQEGIYRDVTLKYECFTNDKNQSPLNGATSKLDITVR